MSGSRRFSVIRDATIEQILADTIGFRDLSWLERGGHSHCGQWRANRSQVRLAIQGEQDESGVMYFNARVPTIGRGML